MEDGSGIWFRRCVAGEESYYNIQQAWDAVRFAEERDVKTRALCPLY